MLPERLGCLAALLLLALPLLHVKAAEAPQMEGSSVSRDSAVGGDSSNGAGVEDREVAAPREAGSTQHLSMEGTWQAKVAQAIVDKREDVENELASGADIIEVSADGSVSAAQQERRAEAHAQQEVQEQALHLHAQHEQQQQAEQQAQNSKHEQQEVQAEHEQQAQQQHHHHQLLAAASGVADPTVGFSSGAQPAQPDPTAQLAAAAAAEAQRHAEAERHARLQAVEDELADAEDLAGWAKDEGAVDVPRGIARLEAMFERLNAMIEASIGESMTRRRPYVAPQLPPPALQATDAKQAVAAVANSAAAADLPVEGDAHVAGMDAAGSAAAAAAAGNDAVASGAAAATDAASAATAVSDASDPGAAAATDAAASSAAAAHSSAGVAPLQQQQQSLQQMHVPLALDLDIIKHPELTPLSDAAFTLASLLASGAAEHHGLPRNDSRAVYILHRAAMVGSLEAKLALADRYLSGRGVPRLPEEGLRHAKAVGPELMALLDEAGAISSNEGGGVLRLKWIDATYQPAGAGWEDANTLHFEQDLAGRGDVEAHRQLGYRMLTGQGMARDLPGAYREFDLAAQGGDPYAQFNLGYMHIRGMHVPQNYTAAREQFMLAAEKNLPAAINGLGVLYFHGQGVKVNYTEAVRYFAMAADRDHDAAYNLATMYQGGYGVEHNITTAIELFQNATELGSWRAPHQLFLVQADGLFGAQKNATLAAATFWRFMTLTNGWRDGGKEAAERFAEGDAWGAAVRYALLAEQGNPSALLNLAWLLHRGSATGGHKRHDLALPLWLRAAERNYTEGMLLAAHAYRDGRVLGGANITSAVSLYQRAAAAGSIEGLFTLGRLREAGLGLERDTSEAVRLYRQAIRTAPHGAFATAPFLALHWLRLRLLFAPVTRLLAACLLLGSGGSTAPAAGGAARAPTNPRGQQYLLRRSPGLPAAAQWDTLLIAAMVGVLTWVLWRKHQLQQGSEPARAAAAHAAGANAPAQEPLPGQPLMDQTMVGPGGAGAADVAPQQQQQQQLEEEERRQQPKCAPEQGEPEA